MPCYILRAGDTDNVKIGWADRDAEQRRTELQCGCWLPLSIIRVIEGPRALEGWLHRRFAAHRGIGEWFTLIPEMLVIEAPAIINEKMSKPENNHPLARYLRAHDLSDAAFGRSIGKSHSTVLRLKRGEIRPSLETIEAIRAATNGDVGAEDFLSPFTPAPEERSAA